MRRTFALSFIRPTHVLEARARLRPLKRKHVKPTLRHSENMLTTILSLLRPTFFVSFSDFESTDPSWYGRDLAALSCRPFLPSVNLAQSRRCSVGLPPRVLKAVL